MADWSQLPPELLHLISKCLEARFDVLRFRSVCFSWRSSVPPKLYSLPTHLPSKTRGRYEYSPRNITINTLYLIRSFQGNPTTEASACRLVKIRDEFDRVIGWKWDPLSGSHVDVLKHVKMRVLNPFSNYVMKPLPCKFPKILDLSNFHVIELGHEYIGRYYIYIDHPVEPQRCSYKQKVVFLRSSTDSGDFIVLALLDGSAFLRSGENEWVELENEHGFQDIISFNGKLYAIDRKGRTKVMDKSLNVSFLEHVESSWRRMFLVKSVDDLLAVEKVFITSDFGDVVVGFRVLKMNEEEQKWDEVESLSDRILFLDANLSVSAAASEFCWGKGNLIFFYMNSHSSSLGSEFVFDLETGTINPVKSCPAYCNLFWPPPQWVTSQDSVISSAQVISNSTHLVPSASAENEYKHPESNLAIPTRVTSAGKLKRTYLSKLKVQLQILLFLTGSIHYNLCIHIIFVLVFSSVCSKFSTFFEC